MKSILLGFIALILIIFTAGEPPFAEECGGRNHRKHDRGAYKFITSSWVRVGDNGHYYSTCVENLSDRDLWFDWFVPGPTTYVPPGKLVTSPRYFQDRQSLDLLGCLQYGNHREPMQEYFIGHENDREQIEHEKEKGCNVSRHDFYGAITPAKAPKITYSANIYIPSDSKDLKRTLMGIDLSVGLEKFGENAMKTTVMYNITGVYKNFSGDPKQIKVKTNSSILRETFLKAGFKGAIVPLTGYKGELSFDIPLPPKYSYSNARYGFFDKNNILVGAIFVPIPTPTER